MNGLLTVAREYENRLNLCTLLQAAPDAVLHLKIPFEDRHTHKKKKLLWCLCAVTLAACARRSAGVKLTAAVVSRQVKTGGLDPLFAFALINAKIPGLSAPLGC